MRTTLNLDEDVLRAVKELAKLREATAGEVLSDLARRALAATQEGGPVRNGVPILEPTAQAGVVTSEIVERLSEAGEG